MSRNLDWDLFRRICDIQPRSHEELLSIPGVGGATRRALSLIVELIYRERASWDDRVKYSFAHGGKGGVLSPTLWQGGCTMNRPNTCAERLKAQT